jgi:DNA polymerase
MGMNQTTKQWGKQTTYGGKLVENIVQAVARDLLAYAMRKLDGGGARIVAHIHDEVVVESPNVLLSGVPLKAICDIMGSGPGWAKGLPLRADGFITEYYKKD